MSNDVEGAISKAKMLKTAFSMGIKLFTYSMLPGYLQNMNGGMILARTNMAIFQPAYTITF
jgi:hypothetical protein